MNTLTPKLPEPFSHYCTEQRTMATVLGKVCTYCGMGRDGTKHQPATTGYLHKAVQDTATLPYVPRLKPKEVDPHGLDAHAPGSKLDAGKALPWLCISGFSHALNAVADVTTKGARKYTPNGWASVQDGEQRYMEAFGRHMMALGGGEHTDGDTGCLHKAQMIWNLLASLELELRQEIKRG